MTTITPLDTEFKRGIGLYASTMVVVGSMIGSGIFLVSAEMGRQTASPGLLLTAWIVTGGLTLAAALHSVVWYASSAFNNAFLQRSHQMSVAEAG